MYLLRGIYLKSKIRESEVGFYPPINLLKFVKVNWIIII